MLIKYQREDRNRILSLLLTFHEHLVDAGAGESAVEANANSKSRQSHENNPQDKEKVFLCSQTRSLLTISLNFCLTLSNFCCPNKALEHYSCKSERQN
jgi:hypothetical protein